MRGDWGGGGGAVGGVSANEYSCAHGAQINVGDLSPYLTDGLNPLQKSRHLYRIEKESLFSFSRKCEIWSNLMKIRRIQFL